MSGRCARLRRAAVRWNSRGNSSEDRRPGGTSRAWSISSNDGSIATLNAVHSGLAMTTIAMLGSPEQRTQYLPRMATCEVLGAFALTEPNHSSDVVALETRARRDGDEWVQDGQNGGSATAPSPTSWSSGPATTRTRSAPSWSNTPTAPSTRLPRPDDRRQGREPRSVAGSDLPGLRPDPRGRPPRQGTDLGRRQLCAGQIPANRRLGSARPRRGRLRSRRHLIPCAARSSAAHWPGSS